jgi:L-lactate dehydrogenase complex protein LldG
MSVGRSDAARKEILQRIRQAQGRGASAPSPSEHEAVETYLRAHPRGPLRPLGQDLTGRFRSMAESMQTSVDEVELERDVPQAASSYLERMGLPLRGSVWPALAHIDWKSAGFELAARGAQDTDPIGITGAFAGLAETGTLMLVSGDDTPATVSLLPETHIAVLARSRLVPYMEDAWDLARRSFGHLPRAVNFISGPSRTADIEQKMVLGAHGPYRVHVILVRGA